MKTIIQLKLQVAATAGFNVTLVEVNNDLIERAQQSIKNNLTRVAKKQFKDDADQQNKFVSQTIGRINGSSNLVDTVKNTDLVIEAIVENITIKHNLFESIDKVLFDCIELLINFILIKTKN